MAYSDFTLEALIQQFGLEVREHRNLFGHMEPRAVSDLLSRTLEEGVPMALDVGTEKARSELIIAPVMMEVWRQLGGRVSLFSGIDFNVDAEHGLRGACDFLFSSSPLQLAIQAPVVAVVEAKNENMRQGINQCIAELVAAQKFNREHQNEIDRLHGAVTTGNNWKFLRLQGSAVAVDRAEYHIKEVEKLVGILLTMIEDSIPPVDPAG